MNAVFLFIRKVVKTSQYSFIDHIHIFGIRQAPYIQLVMEAHAGNIITITISSNVIGA